MRKIARPSAKPMTASASRARRPKPRAVQAKTMVVARTKPPPSAMQAISATRPPTIQSSAPVSAASGFGRPSRKATTRCASPSSTRPEQTT